jgi:hypothetical protein
MLTKHHEKYLIPIVSSRINRIRAKVLKEFGANWGDYNDDQIDQKVTEKSDEYFRLKQVLLQLTIQTL